MRTKKFDKNKTAHKIEENIDTLLGMFWARINELEEENERLKNDLSNDKDELKRAFGAICNLYFSSYKDNFSRCSVFHISPFNTHWDKRTVKEIIEGLRLYLGTWVIEPLEEQYQLNRNSVKSAEIKRNREFRLERERREKQNK